MSGSIPSDVFSMDWLVKASQRRLMTNSRYDKLSQRRGSQWIALLQDVMIDGLADESEPKIRVDQQSL